MLKFGVRFILLIIFITSSSFAFELDVSVDDEIKQKYNSSKLEQETLPPLPTVLKDKTPSSSINITGEKTIINSSSIDDIPSSNIDTEYSCGLKKVIQEKTLSGENSYTAVKIPKGTTFKVRSKTNISDKNAVGARMTFVSTVPVTKRYISFPTGTTFKGYVEDSHQPNFAGNGGLIKLKIDSISNNSSTYNIDAKIVRANHKIIFLNNIKGKRGYIKGIANNVNKGETFYKKTRQTSSRWSNNPVGVIVSPIPTIIGIAGYGINLVASPIMALWSKGTGISLPSGTDYTIKLRRDSSVN